MKGMKGQRGEMGASGLNGTRGRRVSATWPLVHTRTSCTLPKVAILLVTVHKLLSVELSQDKIYEQLVAIAPQGV